MRIFLSYASQGRAVADTINHALLEQGHDVFFDRDDLPAGEEYHSSIRRAIQSAELFVFLISEHAIDDGSYTLTELSMAATQWKQPSGRLLPVMLRPTALERLPAFVTAVTVLQSPGNIAAATADAVQRITRRRQRALLSKIGGAALAAAVLAASVLWLNREQIDVGPVTLGNEVTGSDGAISLLVPGGSFVMGDDDASPRREIHLDTFYIDRYEVTVGRYATFLAATGSVQPPEAWDQLDRETQKELPVVGVDWKDANAYCSWAGRRLPTDAEWEKAARGTDERRYPWGNLSPTIELTNYENASPSGYAGGLTAVGTYPQGRSPYGAHDMSGNAAEWVADWFTESFPASEVRNPKGPATGTERVVRGGGRMDSADRILATKRYRDNPAMRNEQIGFRCARDP